MLKKYAVIGLAAATVYLGVGCEADQSRIDDVTTTAQDVEASAKADSTASTASTTSTEPASAPAPSFEGDELNVSSARSLGTHSGIRPQDARVTRAMYSANKEGDVVRMDFDTLNWPKDGQLDGRVCMYWKDGGEVIGGHFDWHKVGQTVKTLENINGGYLGGKRPAKGSPIWFCIINNAGTERTNMKQSSSNW